MGQLFGRTQRGPTEDVEDKSARLDDKVKKPSSNSKPSHHGRQLDHNRKSSEPDSEKKKETKISYTKSSNGANNKESSEGRSDGHERRRARKAEAGENGASPVYHFLPSPLLPHSNTNFNHSLVDPTYRLIHSLIFLF